jgi:hypothetical protein
MSAHASLIRQLRCWCFRRSRLRLTIIALVAVVVLWFRAGPHATCQQRWPCVHFGGEKWRGLLW